MDDYKKRIENDKEQRRRAYLEKKYAAKPYHIQYKSIYWIVNIFGFQFNILSGLGAFSFCYILIYGIFQNAYTAAVLSILIVGLWEALKRFLIITANEKYYKDNAVNLWLVAASIFIIGGSCLASYLGTDWTIKELDKGPQKRSIREEAPILLESKKETVARIEKLQNDQAYRVKSGEIAHNIKQFTIPQLEVRLDSLTSQITSLETEIRQHNANLTITHKAVVSEEAWHYALFVGVCDLLLILCLTYKEYFEHIETLEKNIPIGATRNTETAQRATKHNGVQRNGATVRNANSNKGATAIIATQRNAATPDELRKKKAKLRAYKSKLRKGEGNSATIKSNIAQLESEINNN